MNPAGAAGLPTGDATDGASSIPALSVSEFNLRVRDRLQSDLGLRDIWVEGEIANLNQHSSGHVYFSLKDAQSTLSCTLFRPAAQRHKHLRLQNGAKLLAQGTVSVYAPRGQYQFNVVRLVAAGEGELRLKIEELRRRLEMEGLFQAKRKRALPELPLTLGVATASTGAAIQDIIRVARTRFPTLNILLAPCIVQGDGAEDSIVAAIEALQTPALGVDLIIAGRGGGSFEDLLAFNSEKVARAFAGCQIPIISAVGHEIDHPISDLAADAFAATPSAAVERAIPELEALLDQLEDLPLRMKVALRNRRRNGQDRLNRLLQSRIFRQPQSMLADRMQSLDLAARDLRDGMSTLLRDRREKLQPFQLLPAYCGRMLQNQSKRLSIAAERLQNFSPLATLQRGYAVVRNERQLVIRSARQAQPGERLEILLAEGRLAVHVAESQIVDA
ncbi:MAG: exodeoxyribonuclease VII large subunit [Leptospirales bacterium]|nr:exodeoxyribonuclease VII large subunit [Leptospirales bacterium]